MLLLALIELAQAFVQLDTKGFQSSKPVYSRHKRDDTIAVDAENQFTYYSIDLEIGSQKEKVNVVLDTGSSDLWVMAESNPYCEGQSGDGVSSNDQVDCSNIGTFNYASSSSFQNSSGVFSISYGDSSYATGSWGSDDIGLGDHTLENATFAIGLISNSTDSVFGIGPVYGESTITTESNGELLPTYDNIPMLLKKTGAIQQVSYSLWLNDIDSSTGNILFGGVDHAKYSGSLEKVPVVNDGTLSQNAKYPTSLSIILSGVGVYNDEGAADVASFALPALLDSGTTLCYFPKDVLDAIGSAVNGTWSDSLGTYVIDCDQQGGITFNFSGKEIEVPFELMVYPTSEPSGSTELKKRDNSCALGFSSSISRVILGDFFLRSVYAVYDLENYEIALAQAKYNVSDSNIEEITSGIPSASMAPAYSSSQIDSSVTTYSPSYTANSESSSESASSSTDASTTSSGDSSDSSSDSADTNSSESSEVSSSSGFSETSEGTSSDATTTSEETSDATSETTSEATAEATSEGTSGSRTSARSSSNSSSSSDSAAKMSIPSILLFAIISVLL